MDEFTFPEVVRLRKSDFPLLMREMPGAPDELYFSGDRRTLFLPDHKYLCIVGSRRYTEYGRRVCEWLIETLRGTPTVIVSGLAMGIDAIAHKSAMANNLKTIAVPGSGLNTKIIYPRINYYVAEDIVKNGGCLLSPFKPNQPAAPWTFPVRNQIMAGLSHATLIIEGEEDSGTLITARLSADYNRDTLVVPGSVFSEHSRGPHKLLRDGAIAITCQDDLLEALGFKTEADEKLDSSPSNLKASNDKSNSNNSRYSTCTDDEIKIISLISSEPLHKDAIIEKTNMGVSRVHILISILETKGLVEQKFGKISLKYPYYKNLNLPNDHDNNLISKKS